MEQDCRELFDELSQRLQAADARYFNLKNKFDQYVALQKLAGEFMKEDTARMARAAAEQAATVIRLEAGMREWTIQANDRAKSRASFTAWMICLAPVVALAVWEGVKRAMGWHS